MVRYRRNFVFGGTFFFTVTLADRRSQVLVEQIALLRSAFREVRRQRPFMIDAIVILPDHLHTVMTLPPKDSDFSGRWRHIKALFTRSVVAKGMTIERNRRGEYSLWQRRFWEHTVRDESDLANHVDYIHYNPVRHGLVSCVAEWPFSSFHRYVRRGLLPLDWAGSADGETGSCGEPVG
jgi:putative transposase